MSALAGKRVLVTGAAGFVGTHVLEALAAQGATVVAADLVRPVRCPADFIPTDLLDSRARRYAVAAARADHLLHLAWISTPGLYWRSPANLDWSMATLDLLRLFVEAGGTRALLVGSCAEYEWSSDVLSEDTTPCRPATLYGAAKDATRRLAEAYGREVGLAVAWARLFYLYGPGERSGRLVADAVTALAADRPFAATTGRQRRDFLHVADVASALAAVLGSGVRGAVNIGSGVAVPVATILETLAHRLGRQDRLELGARPDPQGEPPIIQADIGRLSGEVGFRPRFDLESGLADVLARADVRRPGDQRAS